jgi:hypothetical protein
MLRRKVALAVGSDAVRVKAAQELGSLICVNGVYQE